MRPRQCCLFCCFVFAWAAPDVAAAEQQLVEVFEVERRTEGTRAYELVGYATARGDDVDAERRATAPRGWRWASDWISDGSRGADGWEYAAARAGPYDADGGPFRRRRWLRVMRRRGADRGTAPAAEPRVEAKAISLRAPAAPLRALRRDFAFRGFGLGCAHTVDAGGQMGLVVQLPLTPNFGFWERRSHYLPMATALCIVYPPGHSDYCAVAFVLSVSYPVDVLARGMDALRAAGRPQNATNATAAPRTSWPTGPRGGVRRVGVSLSRTVAVRAVGVPGEFRSPVRLRPWFMYAPGLGYAYDFAERVAERALARAARALARGPTSTAANASAADASAADQWLARSSTATRNASAAVAQRRRPLRRAAEAGLAAVAAARGWGATKFALLGYSFLPYQAYLTDARAAAAAPDAFRPLRGSLIFMMRPFYPPRLGRSVKKPP